MTTTTQFRRSPFRVWVLALAAAFACCCNPRLIAQTATGAITGRVQNEATGQYLNNARVTVKGTDLAVFTDDTGSFRLPQVPAGPVVDYQEACGHVFALTAGGLLRLVSAPGTTTWVSVPTQLSQDFSGGRLHVVSNELYLFTQSGDAERLTLACP